MKRNMNMGIFLALTLILTSFSGCFGGDNDAKRESFPDWTSVTDDDNTYSKSSLLGTKYIIHFSASWCTPCREVMHEISNDIPDEVSYFIVSTDADDTMEVIEDWHLQVNESNETNNVSAPFMENALLAQEVDIRNTPTLFLVDEEGKIASKQIGSFESLEDFLIFCDKA